MKVVILIEGKTERAFMPTLRKFLAQRLAGRMPNLDPLPYDGRIPKGEKLRRVVDNLLNDRSRPTDAVIALSDVYTGTRDFIDAADAKSKMRQWAGENPKFYPHVAQYDFEAWLLPFWPTIQRLAKHNQNAPSGAPETINHDNPPAHKLKAIFEIGNCRDSYVKPRDAKRILAENDLLISANACPELKAFLNTILTLCGGEIIP
ncbi:MAG: DUF4276 family protein [Anaerolineae bacterium]